MWTGKAPRIKIYEISYVHYISLKYAEIYNLLLCILLRVNIMKLSSWNIFNAVHNAFLLLEPKRNDEDENESFTQMD